MCADPPRSRCSRLAKRACDERGPSAISAALPAISASSSLAARRGRSLLRFFRAAGTAWGERESERYISVSKRLSAYADIESRGSKPQTEPLSLCNSERKGRQRMRLPRTTLIRGPTFREPSWVRGVAWSILGGSGPLDSGSNPDGPITDLGRVRWYRFGYVNTTERGLRSPRR